MKSNENNKITSSEKIVQPKSMATGFNFQAFNQRSSTRRKQLSAQEYVDHILEGNINYLSQAITLIESNRQDYRSLGAEILELCLPHSGNSIRIGVTGSPGVGKSTFIESLGNHLIQHTDRKIAVLAIDPSSQISKGSILGDKTRMEKLSTSDRAFIRPSPTSETLGGVAQKTRETIFLCEAGGFDTILVETVGVGQSETAVQSMVDIFLLLLLPGAGDSLQGIKRGIVEMADLLLINKAEEERKKLANEAKRAYRNALHLFPQKENEWQPIVETCSAMNGENIDKIWALILAFQKLTTSNNYFHYNRRNQSQQWFRDAIEGKLKKTFFENDVVQLNLKKLQQAVIEGKLSSSKAAEELMNLFLETIKQ